MADHPNATLLRNGYAAFERGDMAALTELFSPDVVWHLFGNVPPAGTHKGRDAVFAAFAKTMEMTDNSFKIDIHDVVANDEHAVVLSRGSARRKGKQLEDAAVDVYHMKDGKITEFWSFTEDTAKADAFWS